MRLNRTAQRAQKLFSPIALFDLRMPDNFFLRTIIAPELQATPCNLEGLAWSKLIDALHDRVGTRNIEQRQEICDSLRTNSPFRHSLQKRWQLRRKEHPMSGPRFPRLDRVVQRFDAQAITNQQHQIPLSVPESIGKHAPQPIDCLRSLLFIEMDQNFRIAMGLKAVAFLNQFLAEFSIIIDLSVQDRPDRTGFVSDRLMTACWIDDT